MHTELPRATGGPLLRRLAPRDQAIDQEDDREQEQDMDHVAHGFTKTDETEEPADDEQNDDDVDDVSYGMTFFC